MGQQTLRTGKNTLQQQMIRRRRLATQLVKPGNAMSYVMGAPANTVVPKSNNSTPNTAPVINERTQLFTENVRSRGHSKRQNSKNEVLNNRTKIPRKTQLLAMIWKNFDVMDQRWRINSLSETNQTHCKYLRTKQHCFKINLCKYERFKISLHFPLDCCTTYRELINLGGLRTSLKQPHSINSEMASLTKSLNLRAEDLLGITKCSGKSKKGIL